MTAEERLIKLGKKYYYDKDLAKEKVRFVEDYCTHVKGDLAGEKLILEDWQKQQIFYPIFGLLKKKGGRRLINRVYIQMPRKNGKTTMCAPIELLLLLTDAEGGAEIYNCAGDDKQAKILFDITKQMVSNSPKLSSLTQSFQSRILYKDRYIEKITSKSDTKHGFNSHGYIYDEIHVAPNRELYDTLKTSTGQRSQPLGVAITTPGTDKESICYELYNTSKQILDGVIEMDNFWCVIYESDKEKDDPFSEETWRKANPLYNTSLYLREYIKQESEEAKNNPSYENTFKRLHLGQWTESETRWLNTEDVEGCYNPDLKIEDYYGLECYMGLDFAASMDMVAFSILVANEEVFKWFCWLWIPEKKANEYEKKYNHSYTKWGRDGWINIIPGNIVEYRDDVEPLIVEQIENFHTISFGYDKSYGTEQQALKLQNDYGVKTQKVTQGFAMFPGIAEMGKRIIDRKIEFNNPVLKWQFDNVKVKTSLRDMNLKQIIKEKEEKKIDGVVSGVIALQEFRDAPGYEEVTEIMRW